MGSCEVGLQDREAEIEVWIVGCVAVAGCFCRRSGQVFDCFDLSPPLGGILINFALFAMANGLLRVSRRNSPASVLDPSSAPLAALAMGAPLTLRARRPRTALVVGGLVRRIRGLRPRRGPRRRGCRRCPWDLRVVVSSN